MVYQQKGQVSKYEEGQKVLCIGTVRQVWMNRNGKIVYEIRSMQDDVIRKIEDTKDEQKE